MDCLTPNPASEARLSRREKHVARLLPKVEAVLKCRSEESPCADGFRFEPLGALVRALGYTLTEAHPHGNPRSREIVTDALTAYGRAGPFIISVRSVSDWLFMRPRAQVNGAPIPRTVMPDAQPRGIMRDPVWVAYWLKDRPTIIAPAETPNEANRECDTDAY